MKDIKIYNEALGIDGTIQYLPDVNSPCYKDSLCDLLLTDQDDYNRISNPYYEIEEKVPGLVAGWIRDGLSVMIKAV